MWSRTDSGLLYRFEWTEYGYSLTVTDLLSVFTEEVRAEQIAVRGDQLSCPFALSTPQNILTFGKVLNSELCNNTDFNFLSEKAKINAKTSGIEWIWEFDLKRLEADQTAILFGSLVSELLEVIKKAAELINARNSVVSCKDLVIQGLLESGRRGVVYKPPPFLTDYLSTSNLPSVTAGELIESHGEGDSDSDATQ